MSKILTDIKDTKEKHHIKDIDVLNSLINRADTLRQFKIFDEEYLQRSIEIIHNHVCKNCKDRAIYKVYSENPGRESDFIDVIDKLSKIGVSFNYDDMKNYIESPHPEELYGVIVQIKGEYFIFSHSNNGDREFTLYSLQL